MAKLQVVRYDTTPKTPIQDGQVLVDKVSGLMSFDIGSTRIRPKQVYGTFKTIDTNSWIPVKGRYYVNISELALDDIPYGYTTVGASMISGSGTYTTVEDGVVKIYSEDRLSGGVLVFSLPDESLTNSSSIRDLVALYHMEEDTGNFVDGTGNSTIVSTGCVFDRSYKYGYGSVFKSSIGSLVISGLDPMDAFTIEWWQKDTSDTGLGGTILEDANGASIVMPSVNVGSSSIYTPKSWTHIALSRKSGEYVCIYINGEFVGTSELDSDLSYPITFNGARTEDGSSKTTYIDEIAIFNYARYSESFTPPSEPYVGNAEALIGVHGDITISGASGSSITVDIPVTSDVEVSYDTVYLSEGLSDISISGSTLTATILDKKSESYELIVKYPGTVSKKIQVHVDNTSYIEPLIYYGYFTSDTIQSVTDITSSELAQSSISTMALEEMTQSIGVTAPAGSYTVILVPADTSLKASKIELGQCIEFSEDNGTAGTGSNGGVVTINGTTYRVYGEFNIIQSSIQMIVTEGYGSTDAVYVEDLEDAGVFTLVDSSATGANRVWESSETVDTLSVESSNSDISGIYVYDEETNTWSIQ